MQEAKRFIVDQPTEFDYRVGIRSGFTGMILEGDSAIVKVRFDDWKHPDHPLFDKGERMMLAACLKIENPKLNQ